jgi:hypothetical protein
MGNTNLDMEEVYMGFIASGICKECGGDTFAADEVCYTCKVELAEADRIYFKPSTAIDCE